MWTQITFCGIGIYASSEYDRTIFVNLESEGAKKSKYWENHL